jgi:hypothetical protein
MIIWDVRYGDGLEVMLRDPYTDLRFLRGIECNELGVAVRNGCRDSEFIVRIDRIEKIKEVG